MHMELDGSMFIVNNMTMESPQYVLDLNVMQENDIYLDLIDFHPKQD